MIIIPNKDEKKKRKLKFAFKDYVSNSKKAIDKCCESPCVVERPKFRSITIDEVQNGWIVSSWNTGDKVVARTMKDVIALIKTVSTNDIIKSLSKKAIAGLSRVKDKKLPMPKLSAPKKRLIARMLEVMNQRNAQILEQMGTKHE